MCLPVILVSVLVVRIARVTKGNVDVCKGQLNVESSRFTVWSRYSGGATRRHTQVEGYSIINKVVMSTARTMRPTLGSRYGGSDTWMPDTFRDQAEIPTCKRSHEGKYIHVRSWFG